MKKAQWSFNRQTLFGVLKQLSLLALFVSIGGVALFIWLIFGINIAPFDDPYLSNAEYKLLVEQENQLINLGLWVGKIYVASLVIFFAARIVKVFRAQG